MRVVVAGARGYVGSRLVPALLERGHEVVATATGDWSRDAFTWRDQVEWVRMDALDAASVATAIEGADAVCYLVHALDRPGFADLDREAARVLRAAVADAGTPRLVYLSGLVPTEDASLLSGHLASRLEVERILLTAPGSVLSLRAGVVIGAGSTSFEIIRQLASALLVQPVPSWMTTRVQPIGIGDVTALLVAALESESPTGARDIGGPDVVAYPDLLAELSREARLLRVQLPAPSIPLAALSRTAPWLTAAPPRTVAALVASLQHDMVCDARRQWALPGVATPLRAAIRASLAEDGPAALAPYRRQPGDPAWTSSTLLAERLTGLRLPLPAVARNAALAAEERTRNALARLGRPS